MTELSRNSTEIFELGTKVYHSVRGRMFYYLYTEMPKSALIFTVKF